MHNHLWCPAKVVISKFAAISMHNLGYPAIIMHDVGENFWLGIGCEILVFCRLIGRSIRWLVVVLSWPMKMLNDHSRNGENHSWPMHQIYESGGGGRQSLVRALVCYLWYTGEVGCSSQQMRRPRCFRLSLCLSSAGIVFSSLIRVTLLQYSQAPHYATHLTR